MQSEVAHHGGDQCVGRQFAGLLHRQREHHHDGVAVDELAVGVQRQAPVGVPVVGEAQVGTVRKYRGPQRLQVCRSAAVVDVEPIGLGVDRDDPSAGGAVGARCGRRSRAVGAVDDHGQAVERLRAGLTDMAQVAIGGILGVDDAAEPGADRAQTRPGDDQLFDLVLGVVVQLATAGARRS